MDGDRFDALTRAFGAGRSRRSLLKSLGATALGAAGLSRLGAADAKRSGFDNTACVNFCNAAFQKGSARYACQQAGAHGSGPCAACGASIANYCDGTCTNVSTDVANCGACGQVCFQPVYGAATCQGGICGTTHSCFVAGTRVAMADGTSRPIERVAVGDQVLGQHGVNRVSSIERPRLGTRRLYALNDGSFFVTAEHPFLTEDGWKAVDPAATAAENPNLVVGRLAVGDRLLALVGVAVPVAVGGAGAVDEPMVPRLAAVSLDRLVGAPADPATPLYNLRLDGDHAYFANELLVHNK